MGEKIVPNELFFAWVAEELKQGKSVKFKVNGTSMLPLIRSEKDFVTVTPINRETSVSKYDIVLFKYNDRHVLHRIIGLADGNGKFRLRGDGSYFAEESCTYSDILGVVTQIYRGESTRAINPHSRTLRLYARLWHSMPGFFRRFALKVLKRILR